ncbi:MAG: hypothetical protein AB2792_15325 [Candidatus Thiodiazotropha sp.]
MKKRIRQMLGYLILIPLPAFAFHCPMDMKKIDAALASNPPLSGQQLAEVRELRAKGETYHRSGRHDQSVHVLGRAMKILGIQ